MMLLLAFAIHYFGHDAPRPKRAAFTRVGTALLFALVLGIAGIRSSMSATIPMLDNPFIAIPYLLIFAQCCGLISLGCSSAIIGSAKGQLLSLLPVTAPLRWVLFVMPHLVVLFITLLCILGPLAYVSYQLGLPYPMSSAAVVVGLTSAFSLLQPLPKQWHITRVLGLFCLVIFELWLLRQAHFTSVPHLIAACALVGSSFVVLPYGYRHVAVAFYQRQTARRLLIHMLRPSVWYVCKALRHQVFRKSILVTLLLSMGIAAAISASPFKDAKLITFCGALLAASCATDIRPMLRKYRPAEIAGLRGCWWFFRESSIAYALILLALMPLLLSLIPLLPPGSAVICSALQILLGLSCGNLLGTYIVPQRQNVSAQCVAVFSSTALLWLLLRPLALTAKNPLLQIAIILLCCFVFELARFRVEYKRNHFSWR